MVKANGKSVMKRSYLKDYRDHAYKIPQAHLVFELNPQNTQVTATLSITRKHTDDQDCYLYGEKLKLIDIQMNGQVLNHDAYQVNEKGLTIFNPPESFELKVVNEINPSENLALSGLYMSKGNFCTQCESHGFRRITYFIDRPDNMTEFTTEIIADKAKYPVLLGNGNCIHRADEGDLHRVIWHDPSLKPSYLFALVAGQFESIHDTFITKNNIEVRLGVYVEQGKIDQAQFAMTSLKHSMRWDEAVYDCIYDLTDYNVVGVSDFNFGAMENKGLNIFNTAYLLANPVTSTDADYLNVLRVIGHEYFHNWSGNRVTLRNWFQLSLKEGLTVYREQSFMEDMTEAAVARIGEVHILRTHQFAEDAGPMAHPVRPASYISMNNFYTTTIYDKGAEVVRMLETLLGREAFIAGVKHYFKTHDGQAVTTDDFVRAHETHSQVDLSQFKRWYDQPGTPVLDIHKTHDEATGVLTLSIKQSIPNQTFDQPLLIPFMIGFVGDAKPINVNDAKVVERPQGYLLLIDQFEQSFRFEGLYAPVALSLNRRFSAPVIVNYPYTHDALIELMQHDTDLFNVWDALQALSKRIMMTWLEAGDALKAQTLAPDFIVAIKSILAKGQAHGRFIALCLTELMPKTLLQEKPGADIMAIHAVCQHFYQSIARACRDELHACYKAALPASQGDFDYPVIAARSLKQKALIYLSKAGDDAQEAHAHYQQAHNMTDRMGALLALNERPSSERTACLDEFKARFKGDALVIHKWLSLQASFDHDDVHALVRNLLHDPLYDGKNPNDARALLGAYANNPRFHDLAWDNYMWLANHIIDMDGFNPQLAARFVGVFVHHRLFDEKRKTLMIKALEHILANAQSDDVKEVAKQGLPS